MSWSLFLIDLSLVILVLCDMKWYWLPDGVLIFLAIAGIVAYGLVNINSAILLGMIFALIDVVSQRVKGYVCIGWGDVKMAAVCGFMIPLHHVGTFCIISGLGGVLWALISQKKWIPLGVPMAISTLTIHHVFSDIPHTIIVSL